MTSKRQPKQSSEKHEIALPGLEVPQRAMLQNIDPTAQAGVQPAWIVEEFPEYAQDHAGHQDMTSVREFTHNNHTIRITTTYVIEVDGEPVWLHAMVNNEGKVFSHIMPFNMYDSANDMVKQLIDRLPQFFADANDSPVDSDDSLPEHDHDHEEHTL